jgi:hypothetical protein
VVNIGALQDVAEQSTGVDFKAFQLPVAIIFAVTGVSRASSLVLDIQGGYLDRMLVSPVSRPALLLGLMVADIVLVLALSAGVTALAVAIGVRFATGLAGVALFLVLASLWGLAFTGFPYAIALRTGNPAAVNSSFVLFFPFAFLTSAFVPLDAMTGWLQAVARLNPVTYLLEGMRAIVSDGLQPQPGELDLRRGPHARLRGHAGQGDRLVRQRVGLLEPHAGRRRRVRRGRGRSSEVNEVQAHVGARPARQAGAHPLRPQCADRGRAHQRRHADPRLDSGHPGRARAGRRRHGYFAPRPAHRGPAQA